MTVTVLRMMTYYLIMYEFIFYQFTWKRKSKILLTLGLLLQFLANVNSSSCSLYVIVGPSVVCRLSVVCDARAPYSDD